MPEIVGGLQIKTWEFTRSWGIEPASASGRGVIAAGASSSGVAVGEYYAFSFGGIVFYGIISSAEQGMERETGYEYPFSMVDNRVRLGWSMVFGQWNMAEDADVFHANPFPLPSGDAIDNLHGGTVGFDQGVDFTGGLGGGVGLDNGVDFGDGAFPEDSVEVSALDPGSISRGRQYGHIVPKQWGAQLKIYTSTPRSAASILAEAFANAVGGSPFALNFHTSQQKPAFNVDANSGMTLAALVAQLAEAQGLQVTLDGQSTLRFARRGGGTLVIPDGAHVTRDGLSISSEPTRVRVLGDRVLVQMNSIDLEPDWKPAWEAFIDEPTWVEEVKRVVGLGFVGPPLPDNLGGRAELVAKTREITLAQYIKAIGGGGDDELAAATATYSDHGRFGKVSRMDLPAWVYINSLVYRSYRIPDATLLMGLPMRAMEIHENLLCAVEISGTGEDTAIQYRQSPIEFYPPGQAYVIAKGQPLDLNNTADCHAILRIRIKNMRNEWSENDKFTVDAANHSILFNSPVFLDGDPAEGKSIFLFPNKGEGGHEDLTDTLDSESSYFQVCTLNRDYRITAAPVRCAMVFRLGRFYKDFGTGPRWTTANCASITEHLLDSSGGTLEHDLVDDYAGVLRMPNPADDLLEILYDNGSSAVHLANDQAAGLIVRSGTEVSGSYTRYGAYGTQLNSAINRVSISITFEDGLREVVEFAKPQPTRGFLSSKDIAHRVKSEELFSGQEDLRREVVKLRFMSKLERMALDEKPRSTSHQVISDVFRKPFGAENPSTRVIADPDSQWPDGRTNPETDEPITGWLAGDLVWQDDRGLPSRSGQAFAGVVVCDSPRVADGEETTPIKYVTICTDGSVPCACEPGLTPSASLMATAGDWRCTVAGNYPVGMLLHNDPVPGTTDATLAYVRLHAGGGGAAAPEICPFGEIYTYQDGSDSDAEPNPAIRGGMVYCGDKNFLVPPDVIDLTVTGAWLAFMRIECESNRDDDEEIFLPGIKTSADDVTTFWDEITWTADPVVTYEDNVNPDISTGLGTIIIPIGKYTVTAGVGGGPNTLKLEPVGCGDITINQCGGTLSFTRG